MSTDGKNKGEIRDEELREVSAGGLKEVTPVKGDPKMTGEVKDDALGKVRGGGLKAVTPVKGEPAKSGEVKDSDLNKISGGTTAPTKSSTPPTWSTAPGKPDPTADKP